MSREDWVGAKIGDIFSISTGNTPSKKEPYNYGGNIPFVKPPELCNRIIKISNEFLSDKGALKARLLPRNSVLVTCIGNLGRVGINKIKIAFNQQINAIKPILEINPLFTFYQAQSLYFRLQLEKLSSATTVSIVNKGNFETINFWIVPIPEQRAIVAKIEQLFSDLDNGIANLKTAQDQLKIYRQAVLKKAFEGELTKEWRDKQIDLPSAEELLEQIKEERAAQYQKQMDDWEQAVDVWEGNGKEGRKPGKPKKAKELPSLTDEIVSNNSNLPNNWISIRQGELIEEPKYGTSKKCSYESEGKGVLRIPNIGEGTIDSLDLKFAEFSKEELHNYQLKENDILIIRSNGSVDLVGKCALIKEQDKEFIYAGYLIRLRPISTFIHSKYLLHSLSSIELRTQIESKAKSTSGVNNINSGELASLIISFCSLEEQTQIVKEIESRLSVCDKVEEIIKESLKKAEALRQSILKKAFEGRLLSKAELDACREEEDWEPAGVLLDRIKRERSK